MNLSAGDVANAQLALEAVKLLLQFVGALVIARLTVRWALGRYKSEKVWERRLAAYADVLTAVTGMQRIVGEWFNQEIEDRKPSADYEAEQKERYRKARRQLEDGVATGMLLLPQSTADILSKLLVDLEKDDGAHTIEEHYDCQYGILKSAATELVSHGRTMLGVAPD